MHLTFLKEAYRHMEWSDAKIWTAIFNSEAATADTDVKDIVVHYHGTQRAFLDAWLEKPIAFGSGSDFNALSDVYPWAKEYYDRIYDVLNTVSQEALDQEFELPWAVYFEKYLGPSVSPPTMGQTIYQVVSHSMHHRGQACRRVRELGGTPPTTDYIGWAWLGKPEAEWPR